MTTQDHFQYAIVGTGYAGQCAAIKLQQSGRDDFVLLERAATVGGTWRDNAYPGAACDVPSHLYSLSFEQNPDWSRKYPSQPELYQHIKDVAVKYGLMEKIRFNTDVQRAVFDEGEGLWHLTTSTGALTARFIISGAGGLSEPALPDIKGIKTFQGHTFHSARWGHDYDLKGKRVAVIGTGASSIQFVPEIVGQVARLDLYQRTPPWIVPREDPEFTRLEKALFRNVKGLQNAYRQLLYWQHETRVLGLVVNPALIPLFQKTADAHRAAQVKDPVLRKKLTPDYTMGCKRVLISSNYYPAVARDNCHLITEGIDRITAKGVKTVDGIEREVDAIIFGTGFHATDHPFSHRVIGRGGKSMAEAWENSGAEAYVGTTVHGFPNHFMLMGPNTGIGHTSALVMIEGGVNHALACIEHAEKKGGAIEVKKSVQDRFNEKLQRRLKGSVWATGCSSWYQDKNGKITALWPGFTFMFRLLTDNFRAADYTLTHASARPARRVAG